MTAFLQSSLDYILFIYGTTLVLLTVICVGLNREDREFKLWNLLGFSSFIYGAGKWVDMLALSLGDNSTLKWIRFTIALLSYLLLFEFGRLGLKKYNIRAPGRWIYALVAVFIFIAGLTDISHIDSIIWYIPGLPGAVLAGVVFICEAHRRNDSHSFFINAAGISILFISSVNTLLIHTALVPASTPISAMLLSLQTLLTMFTVYCIWTVYRLLQKSAIETNLFRFVLIPGTMVVLLALGWWVAVWRGTTIDSQLRHDLLNQASSISRTISADQANALSFTYKDTDNPGYQRLCTQLSIYSRFMGQKGIYSIKLRDGDLYFGPESYKRDDPLASTPGTRYKEPPDGLKQLIRSANSTTFGPYKDEFGTVVSAYAPVKDPYDNHVIMFIGVDFVADKWKQTVAFARLLPILLTFALIAIIMTFSSFLAWRCRLPIEYQLKFRYLETFLVAAVGLVLSVAFAYLADNSENSNRHISFSQLAEAQMSQIIDAINDVRDKQLAGLVRFLQSSESVSSVEFSEYAVPMLTDNFISEIGWAPRIRPSQRSSFEAFIRKNNRPDFSLNRKSIAESKWHVSKQNDYFPVLYAEKRHRTDTLVGNDLASDHRMKAALYATLDTGLPTITEPIQVTHNSEQSLSVFMPVHNSSWNANTTHKSISDKSIPEGVVYVTMKVDSWIGKSTQYLADTDLNIHVDMYQLNQNGSHINMNSNNEILYFPTSTHSLAVENQRMETFTILPLFVFGKVFALIVHATPQYFITNPRQDGWQTGLAGVLLTAILASLTTLIVNRRLVLERQVQARTLMLSESEEEHRRLIDNAVTGFALFEIISDELGNPVDYVFHSVNQAFEIETGLPASEIVGQSIIQFIPGIVDTDICAAFNEVALSGKSISIEQYIGYFGRYYYINAYKAGKNRLAAFILDISARKDAEEEIRKSREQYMLAVNGSKDGIWDWNLLDDTMFLSTKWKQMIGYEDWELPNIYSTYEEHIHPEDRSMVIDALNDYLKNKTIDFNMEFRFLHRDGSYIWVLSRGEALRDETGIPYRMAGSHTDITARKQVELELHLINLQLQNAIEEASQMALQAELSKHELDNERASLQAIFDAAQVGMLLVDDKCTITKVNDSVGQMVGKDMSELLGQHPGDGLCCIHTLHLSGGCGSTKACNDCLLRNTLRHVQESGEIVRGEEIAQRLMINGKERLFYFSINASPIEIDEKRHVLLAIMDITDRKQTEVVLKRQAHHDTLTGLPNRLQFNKTLSSIVHSRRKSENKIGVMFIDLDRFKVVNDSLGHDIGDRLLIEVSKRLSLCVREHDTICRMGGDEFTIILRPLLGVETIHIVANRILNEIDRPFTIKGHVINIGASIGASMYPQDGTDVASIVKKADTAMYKAKDLGRNNCQIYTIDMDTDTKKRVKMESELRMALANEQFVVHYQPRIDPMTGRFQSVEALVRWHHPNRGLLLPSEFMSVAEESGIIVQIDDFVFRTVCARLRLWIDAGYSPDCVSVHFSEAQMKRPNCTEYIAKYLGIYDLPASSIAIEIPGTSLLCIPDVVQQSLQELRDQGLNIILDDFGTGPISLLTLNKASVDCVKLDGTLLKGVSGDSWDNVAVAASITSSAHNLGLQVIAVGVETYEQMLLVGSLMCDSIQGHQVSPPLCVDEFEQYMRIIPYENRQLLV